MPRIFVSVVGQDDNVGDSVLRRGLLNSLRDAGELHVYAGTASVGYTSGLGIQLGDTVYSSRHLWRRALRRAARKHKAAFAFNAGEVTPSARNAAGRAVTTLDLIRVRASGGGVVHTGVGLRHGFGGWRVAMAPSIRLARVVTWRDRTSRDEFGAGDVAPDWAFGLGSAVTEWATDRPLLAISMRGDRPSPQEAWLAAVRDLVESSGLTPVVVVQVKRDTKRAMELAQSLGGAIVPFATDDHAEQETIVREVYSHSAAVISDRLHALIFGVTEGAQPIGLTTSDPEKLARTLAPAGLGARALARDLTALQSHEAMMNFLRGPSPAGVVETARADLAELSRRVHLELSRSSGTVQ